MSRLIVVSNRVTAPDRVSRNSTEQSIKLVGGENRVGRGLVLEDAHRDHRPAWAR